MSRSRRWDPRRRGGRRRGSRARRGLGRSLERARAERLRELEIERRALGPWLSALPVERRRFRLVGPARRGRGW